MRKRILALFLALVMCLSLLPTAAFAEGITDGDTGGGGDGTTITDTTDTTDDTSTGGDSTGGDSTTTDTTDTTDTADDTSTGGDSTGGDSTSTDTTDTTDTPADGDTGGEGADGDDDGDDDIPAVQSAPLLGASSSSSAQTPVKYVDGSGNEQTCTEYTEINGNLPAEAWQEPKYNRWDKWYVVKGADVKITEAVKTRNYGVMLILCDGAKLTFEKGFDGTIYIYGQEKGTGQLVAQNDGNQGLCGIITINGGTVTATSSDKGIDGKVTINRGKLNAIGEKVGFWSSDGLFVNGGEVEISGGDTGLYVDYDDVNINSGKVNISGGTGLHLRGSKLAVNGGTLTVTALRPDGWGISASEYTGTYRHTSSSMTANGGTMIVRNPASVGSDSTGGAINRSCLWIDTFTAQCWWRTADGETEYHSQNVEYTDDDLVGTYFEVTCEKPKNVEAEATVYYTDEKGAYQTCEEYISIKDRGGNVTWGRDGKTTWYYLGDNATISDGTLTIRGDVKLILADRKTLSVANPYRFMGDNLGIKIGGGSSLTVYGVAEMTGMLNITGSVSGGSCYGIHIDGGKLIINGGSVSAAGNGANDRGTSAAIYISGNGQLIVNRGTLSAIGGSIWTTNRGQQATNDHSIGIYMTCANAVTINGGRVVAEGRGGSASSYAVFGSQAGYKAKLVGGTLIAKSYQSGSESAPFEETPDLPNNYYWRTDESEALTSSAVKEYTVYNEYYAELTTMDFVAAPYLEWSNGVLKNKLCTDHTPVTAENVPNKWDTGWYAVSGDVTVSAAATFEPGVRLILCDGATLTFENGVSLKGVLSVYAQSVGLNAGKLIVKNGSDGVAIKGQGSSGELRLETGTVIAQGSVQAVHTDVGLAFPNTYWWRGADGVEFTAKNFSRANTKNYFEITTTDPASTPPTIAYASPAAKKLTYKTNAAGGVAQQLVTAAAGLDEGCTAMYRLKTGNNKWTDWSSTVPTATNAGTYTVQWYIKGSTDTERDGTEDAPKSLMVTIAPMKVALTIPVPNREHYALFYVELTGDKDYVYTGQPIEPQFRLKDVNGIVIPKSEYTCKYVNNIGASKEARIIINNVSGGNYTIGGDAGETYFFEIVRKPLTLEPEVCTVEVAKGTGATVDLALAAKSMGMRSDDGNLNFTFSADGESYTNCGTKYTWSDLQTDTTGYFIVRSDNYQASFKVEITVTDTLNVSATVSSDEICDGESVTLKAKVNTNRSGVSYQWYTVDLYGSEKKIELANAGTGVHHIVLNDLGVHRFVCKATMDGQTVTSNVVTVMVKGRTRSNWGGESSYGVPTAKRVYYNGEYQELVTRAWGEGIPHYRLDGVTDWQESIPTAKDPGVYYVSWYILGHSLSGYPSIGSWAAPAGRIEVRIEATEAEVTFVDGTQEYYSTVNKAFDALKPQSTIRLTTDATYHDTDTGLGKNTDIEDPCTLDLNGMTLSVTERVQGKYMPGTLRIKDTVTITSTAVAERPEETTENTEENTEPVEPVADPVGSIANAVAVAPEGKLTVKGDNVNFSSLQVGVAGTAKLYGGTYGSIVVQGGSCLTLLPDGYAYFDKNGDPVDGDNWKLTEVSVKPHATCTLTSSGACACGRKCLHSDIDSTTGICAICGLQMVARIGSGDTARYFPTLEAAAAATTLDNWVVTLLTDVTTGATLNSTFLRVDLNGHRLSGTVSVGTATSATLTSIKGGDLLNTDLTVKYAVFTWVGRDDTVSNTERTIKSLTLENSNTVLQLGENVTIGTLRVSAEGGYALNKMLPEGYVLKYSESENVTADKTAKRTDTIQANATWYNATIKECAHTSSIDTSGKCSACGKQYGVEMKIGYSGNPTYFSTLSEAAEVVNGTLSSTTPEPVFIKLLADVKEQTGGANKEITLNRGVVTLDLNSKTLTADVTVFEEAKSSDDRKLIMENGGTLKGTLTVKGGTAELSDGTFNAITVMTGAGVGDLLKAGYGYRRVSGWVTGADLKAATVSNVSIYSVSTVSVTPTTSTIASGDSTTLTATVTGAAAGYEVSYQWYEIGADGRETLVSGVESATYTTATDLSVGTHTFVCKATVDGYTATSNAVTVTVQGTLTPKGGEGDEAASLTYTAPAAKDLTYTGQAQALVTAGTIGTGAETATGCTVMYRLGNDAATSFGDAIPTATDAGTYTVQWYIDGGNNYTGVGLESDPQSLTVTIAPKNMALEARTVHAVKEKQVSVDLKKTVGEPISDAEALTFALASDALVGMEISGSTFTFTPSEAVTYTATVNVTWANHRGSFALSIASSEKLSLTVVNVGSYEKTYDGAAVDITDVTANARMLVNGTLANVAGTWSWAEGVTAPVNVAGSGKCSLTFTPTSDEYAPVTIEAQITIKAKDIGGTGITATATGGTYNGLQITPTLEVKYTPVADDTPLTLTEGTGADYTVPGDISATNAGTHTLTITGTGNYTGTRRVQWIIAPAQLTISSLTARKPYDSTAAASESTVLDLVLNGIIGGESLVSGTGYTISAQFDSAAVGTRSVTARVKLLNGNYCFMEDEVPVREVQYSGTATITRCPLAILPTVKADIVRLQQDVSLGTGSYLAADNVELTLPEGIDPSGELHFALGSDLPAKVTAEIDQTTGMLTYVIRGGRSGEKLTIPVKVTLPNFVAAAEDAPTEDVPATQGVEDTEQPIVLTFAVEIELTSRPHEHIRRQPTGGSSSSGTTSGGGIGSGGDVSGSTGGSGTAFGSDSTANNGVAGAGSGTGSGGAMSPGTGDAGVAVYAMLSLSAAVGMCAIGCVVFSRRRRRG